MYRKLFYYLQLSRRRTPYNLGMLGTTKVGVTTVARTLSLTAGLNKEDINLRELWINQAQHVFGWGLLGFLLGRSAIFGELWPFGLAFFAILRSCGQNRFTSIIPLGMISIGISSVIGFVFSLPYYGALALLWAFPSSGRRDERLWLAFSFLLVKIPLHYLLHPVPMVFVVGITECVLAIFSYNLLYSITERCMEEQLASTQLFAFLYSLALILSLNLRWGGFAPRIFLIGLLVALSTRLGGLGVVAVVGPSLGFLALLLGESVQLTLLIVIVSLLLGAFSRFRWGYYLAPILAMACALPGVATAETIQWLVVLLASMMVARFIPEVHLKQLARLIPGTESFSLQNKGHDEHMKEVLDHKIDQYLTVFEELEKTLMGVENPLFYKQMQGMADLLQTMKGSFDPQIEFTRDFEDKILNRFLGADLSHVSVLKTPNGFEVYGSLKTPCENSGFCQSVASFCSGTLESRPYVVVGSNCRATGNCGFIIAPWPRYKLEIGRAKIAQEEISGDNQVTFEIATSKVAILLSDGMGVGLKACTESNVAIRLLESMIKADYDLATAVSLVNRLLLLRNQDDMFVTIDLVVVDLFSGQLEFVKIGSAPSFIKRGSEVEIIHNHQLPVGVLSQVEIETDRRMIKEGEVLIMATDGVLDAHRSIARKDEWMCRNLRRLKDTTDLASMAEDILGESLAISNGQIQDDMMVVVARLIYNDWDISPYRRV